MRFFRQECWKGLPFPSPGDLPDPGIWTCVSYISCIGRWILYHQRHLGSLDEEEETYFLYFFFKWFTLHQRDDCFNWNDLGASSTGRTRSCFLAWQEGGFDLLEPQTCHMLGTDHCNKHFPGSKAAKNEPCQEKASSQLACTPKGAWSLKKKLVFYLNIFLYK